MGERLIEWVTIPGLPKYEVSARGEVRNSATGRVLRPRTDKDGYLCIGLRVASNIIVGKRISRLVCEAFNGPPPPGRPHCAHRDGVKVNNSPENLYWATPSENEADKVRHGIIHFNGEKTHCKWGP